MKWHFLSASQTDLHNFFLGRGTSEPKHFTARDFGGGFGGGGASKGSQKKAKTKKANRLVDWLDNKPKKAGSENKPFVFSKQDILLEALAAKSSSTFIGHAVASTPVPPRGMDPFWDFMPSLISS